MRQHSTAALLPGDLLRSQMRLAQTGITSGGMVLDLALSTVGKIDLPFDLDFGRAGADAVVE